MHPLSTMLVVLEAHDVDVQCLADFLEQSFHNQPEIFCPARVSSLLDCDSPRTNLHSPA
jgi:hypothetical protein